MSEPADNLAVAFARRVAERDNPPPLPRPNAEPAAVQARIEVWPHRTYHLRDSRSSRRMGRMLRALVAYLEHTGNELAASPLA